MSKQERAALSVMGALFTVQILAAGPGLAMAGVMMTPLIRAFHWNHARVSELFLISTITGGLVAPGVGWLMDRIGGRWVMGSGVALMVVGYWMSSLSHSFGAMELAFAVFGAGLMLGGTLPVMVVCVNWFETKRATAGGVLWIGLALGLTITPPSVTWVVAHYGWRMGFRGLAAPALMLVLPLTLLLIRTRPPMAAAKSVAQEVAALPGLELKPALLTLVFWLLLVGDLLYSVGFGSVFVHQITYLIGLGYSPQQAAWVFSAQTLVSGVGAITFGSLADRFGARRMLATALVVIAVGIVAFTAAGNPHWGVVAIGVFVLFWGLGAGCIPPVLPVLLAQTTGLRRMGTLSGVIRFVAAFSTALGPVLAGHLFDVTGSYTPAFLLAAGLLVVAALSIGLVHPAPGANEIPQQAAA